MLFQSTPSWRGRLSFHCLYYSVPLYFNPRPREEGDSYSKTLYFQTNLFQSTPSWRGRLRLLLTLSMLITFQSTPSWRGRQKTTCSKSQAVKISIHALVKRATTNSVFNCDINSISIHALVKRATSFHCLYYTAPLYFNPRPREEGDQTQILQSVSAWYFNPRPREEGDYYFQILCVV